MNKTYIIAEIGINYAYGESKDVFLKNALDLIDISKVAGADAVKFQKRTPELCVPEHQKNKEKSVPWRKNPSTYMQYKNDIEFSQHEYDIIDAHCHNHNITWSASPWDIPSAEFLTQYNLPFIKIASATLTNLDLLRYCASKYENVILSSGMCTEDELNTAVQIFNRNNLTILHCNSSYPAPTKDLNLSYIPNLITKYPHAKIGYSGHEFGLTSTIAAVYLGAEVIERHITKSRDLWGSDQLASVEPQGFIKLTKSIRDLELAYGNGKKIITPDEQKKRSTLA